MPYNCPMPSVQDEKRAQFLEALGLTGSTLSTPDLERLVLYDATGTSSPGVGLTNTDLRRMAGYSQSPTFTGFESDVPKLIPGLAAYYRADKIAGVEIVRDGFGYNNLIANTNFASFETDTAGAVVQGTGVITVTRDTVEKFVGLASLKVVLDGTIAGQGIQGIGGGGFTTPLIIGKTYTQSIYLKGSGTFYLQTRYNHPSTGPTSFNSSNITLTSEWKRYSIATVAPSNIDGLTLKILTTTAQAVTFWADAYQVEEGSKATPYASPSELGVTETGQVWTVHAGSATITGNRVLSTAAPAIYSVAVGVADMSVSATLTRRDTFDVPSVTLRHVDAGNFLMARVYASGLELYKFDAGSAIRVNFIGHPDTVGSYTITATINGSIFSASVGNVSVSYTLTPEETAKYTGSAAGFRLAGNGGYIDDFSVKTLAASDGAPVGFWPDLSGNNRHAIQNTVYPPNLLTQNQAMVETDLTGLTALNGTTGMIRSTAFAAEGVASVELTQNDGTGAAEIGLRTSPDFTAVGGRSYTVLASVRSTEATPSSARVQINWIDSSSVFISSSQGTLTTPSTTGFTELSLTVTAPTNAATGIFYVLWNGTTKPVSGAKVYVDKLGLFEGPPNGWRAPNDPSGYLARPLLRTSPRNLLTYNQATIETDTTGWTTSTGTPTLARSTVQSSHGSASLLLTSTAASGQVQASGAEGNGNRIPVKGSTPYTALASVYTSLTGKTVQVRLRWYDSNNASISLSDGAVTAATVNGWTSLSVTATAPSNATQASIYINTQASAAVGETYYWDKMGIFEGTVTEWVPPVAIPNNRPVVQFDGKDDFLSRDAVLSGGDYTIFIVAKQYSPSVADAHFITHRTAGNATPIIGQVESAGGATNVLLLAHRNNASGLSRPSNPVSLTNLNLVVMSKTTSAVTGILNGTTLPAVGGGVIDPVSAATLFVGGGYTLTNNLSGELAAVIIYDRALSDADRKRVEKWLGSRFGIAVAA